MQTVSALGYQQAFSVTSQPLTSATSNHLVNFGRGKKKKNSKTTLQNVVHDLDSYLLYNENTLLSRFNLLLTHTLLTELFIVTDF